MISITFHCNYYHVSNGNKCSVKIDKKIKIFNPILQETTANYLPLAAGKYFLLATVV
jgi:hypothetical protein